MDQPWFKSYEARVPRTLEYPDCTIDTFLAESARKYPYNTATSFVLSYLAGGRYTVGGKLTYRRLNELADLQPKILAAMHGSTFVGDGAGALRAAADMLQRRLGAAPVDAQHAA